MLKNQPSYRLFFGFLDSKVTDSQASNRAISVQ